MITIDNNLQLQPILTKDRLLLNQLMRDIYPPAYSHFWKDNGEFYMQSQYSEANIQKELLDKKAAYYFVVYNNEIIGNFRFVWDEKLFEISKEKQVKLHRLYLHPKTQNKGLGKKIVSWLEDKIKLNGYQVLWLDAMDQKEQALQFYKKIGYKYHTHTFLNFDLMHVAYRKMNQIYKRI